MARDISAYSRELDRSGQRSTRSSKGGDFNWFSPPKPVRKGEKTRVQVRVLPRKDASGEYSDEYWVRTDQHILTVDGKTKVLNCPDDHDSADTVSSCPLCQLRRDLYKSRDQRHQATAKDLKIRSRCFAVIVLPEAESDQGPFVWGYSQNLNNSICEIAVAKRCFIDDPDEGRNLMLTTNRIGPQRWDIRYSITDLDPSPVADNLKPIMDDLPDLSSLAKVADMADLQEIAALLDPRPSGARSTASVTTPAPAAVAPPAPAVVIEAEGKTYHYSGASGDQSGLTAEAVAKLVAAGGDEHHVWADGMADWQMAKDVSEIATLVTALTTPKTIAPPKAPTAPKRKAGPPAPPKPAGGAAF